MPTFDWEDDGFRRGSGSGNDGEDREDTTAAPRTCTNTWLWQLHLSHLRDRDR